MEKGTRERRVEWRGCGLSPIVYGGFHVQGLGWSFNSFFSPLCLLRILSHVDFVSFQAWLLSLIPKQSSLISNKFESEKIPCQTWCLGMQVFPSWTPPKISKIAHEKDFQKFQILCLIGDPMCVDVQGFVGPCWTSNIAWKSSLLLAS